MTREVPGSRSMCWDVRRHVVSRRFMYAIIATGLAIAAVWVVALRRPPRAVLSTAINDAGTLIAVSYIQADLIPNYEHVHTCLLQINEHGADVLERFTPAIRKGVVRGISDDGRVILSCHEGIYLRSASKALTLIDYRRDAQGVGFTGPNQSQVIIWFESALCVVSADRPNERWELPLKAGQTIEAVNWTGQPLRLAVVTRSAEPISVQGRNQLYTSIVELWEFGRDDPLQSWPISAEIDLGSSVAISRSGEHVLVYNHVPGGQSKLHLCEIGEANRHTVISDPPLYLGPESDGGFRFLGDGTAIYTDSDGRIVLTNSKTGSCEVLNRVGDSADLIDVAASGTLIVMAGRLRPFLEVWHRSDVEMRRSVLLNFSKWRRIEGFIPASAER